MRRSRFLSLLQLSSIVLVTLLIALPAAFAQTFRGGINGTVTDHTGGAIANAAVTAVQDGTGLSRSTTSSSAGEFAFIDLPLGTYTVTATFSGFQTVRTAGVTVSAGSIHTLSVVLPLSTAATTIDVTASDIALDTTTVTQTTVLDSKTVADMPMNGRDFTQMIGLTPGYSGYTGGGYGSLNGTRANQMNWQIDGVDNNDLWHNIPAVNQGGVSGIAGIILPLDAVDQFSAQTQAGPEGGRNPGGTVNLTLRAGTNGYHGSVYYFNRNEAFGAKSPFADTKQKVRNYNFGFSFGAPMLKDKLFGFLTFEKQRFVIGQSGTATEPSVGWQNQAKAILASKGVAVNPVMVDVLNSLWASGNLSQDTVGLANNFHSNDPEFGYSYNGLGKIDWHINDKHTLSAHWFVGQGNQVAPVGSQLLDFYEVAPIHVQNIAIVLNSVLTSHISNQVLAGVNYFNQVFNDYNTKFNVNSLGFATGAPYPNAPNMTIGSADGLHFDQVGLTPPEGRNDITGHLTDQVSWIVGAHQFRFGGEYRQAQLDAFYKRHSVGSFTFDGSRLGGSGYAGALADFLAGLPAQASIAIGDPERQVFVNTWFLNAGDSWQVSPKLNVNYGIRYDYVGPMHNPWKNMSVFRPELTANNGLAFQGAQIDSLYNRYWGALSPRLGASYQVASSAVIRVGYGFYFDTPNLNPFLDNRTNNSAPNGVEGNPGGPDPVYTVGALGGDNTVIVKNKAIFPSSAGYPCSADSQCGVFSINKNFRPSYNQNYSLNVEKTLSSNLIAQVGYVGSSARHLLSLLDINQLNVGAGATALPYDKTYPQYSNINQVESIGTSNYNSLQAQLRIANYHHLSGSFVYTWSHNLDEVTSYRGALPQDSYNFKGDYSNSDFDARNTFVTYLSYEIPGGSHAKLLTNGWQLNSLMNFHGGQPFTVYAGADNSGTEEGTQRANQIGPVHKGAQGQKPGAAWLDPNAFADPLSGFGNTRRNAFYGPGYNDIDLSVFKNTKFAAWDHPINIQFRAEMFNLFNRTNFAPPAGDLTLNDTIGDYNGAPGIGAGEPFNTQFGLKVIF